LRDEESNLTVIATSLFSLQDLLPLQRSALLDGRPPLREAIGRQVR
jgi:hypothetical protein